MKNQCKWYSVIFDQKSNKAKKSKKCLKVNHDENVPNLRINNKMWNV